MHALLVVYKIVNRFSSDINEFLVNDEKKFCKVVNESFELGINHIVNGPYYYSYLTLEEIEKQSIVNKQIKLEMKKLGAN